jgi:tight adherence protein B
VSPHASSRGRLRALALILALAVAVFGVLLGTAAFRASASGKRHHRAQTDANSKERFDIVGENHQTGGLGGRIEKTVVFPQRVVNITVPGPTTLSPSRFRVIEDGIPVQGVAVTQLTRTPNSRYALKYVSPRPTGEREVELSVVVGGVGVIDLDYNAVGATGSHSNTFWGTGLGTDSAAGGAALLLAFGLLVLLVAGRRRGSLRRRVTEFTVQTAEVAAELPPTHRGTRFPGFERVLTRMRWWPKFRDDVENAAFAQSPTDLVAIAAVSTLVVTTLAAIAVGTVAVAILIVPLGVIALLSVVRHKLTKRRQIFSEQLASHLEELASAMRAGHGLVSGLSAVTKAAPEPSRAEWTRALSDEQLGMPLEEAMGALAGRMDCDDVEQVALVASLHHRTGGNMAEVLDRVSEGVRERAELRRELRALTSQVRLSRWVVTLLPVALVLVIDLIDPRYMRPLFHTTAGFIVLAFAVTLVTIGSLIMRKMTEIKV